MSSGGSVSRDVIIAINVRPGKGNDAATKTVRQQATKLNRDLVQTEQQRGKQTQQIDEKVIRNRMKLLARIEKEKEKAAKEEKRRREKEEREAKRAAERKAREAARQAEKEAKERERAAKREAALREREAAREQARIERAKNDYVSASDKKIESERRLLEQSRTTLQGVLDVTQGLATLGIASEESLEKFARQFVKIQAAFQVFRGGLDILLGATDAMRAYRQATEAAAAAQAALNTVTAAGETIGGVAGAAGGAAAGAAAKGAAGRTGGGVAGSVVGGAAGAAATGVVAKIGGAISSLFPTFASGSVATILAGLGKGAAIGAGVGEGFNFLRTGETATGVIRDLFRTRGVVSDQEERITREEERRTEAQNERQRAIAAAQQRAGIRASIRSQRESFAFRMDATSGVDDSEIARRQRERAQADELAALAEQERAREIAEERRRTQRFAFSEAELAATQELLEARQRIADADERAVQAVKAQADERKRAVEQARLELQAARDLVKQEQARADSALARFGKLGKGEQDTLRRIAQKRQAGEDLTVQEAQFLEQTGFGASIAQDVFRRQGEAAGGRSILESLGELDGLKEAQRKAAQAAKDLEIAEAKRAEATERLTEVQERFRQSMENVLPVLDEIAKLQARIAGLGDDLSQITGGNAQEEEVAAAVAGSAL
jgi:chromosome segregation ATPase